MRYWSIYCITSPSGKQYVGQTKSRVSKRWSQHKEKCDSPKLANAIRKYGPDRMLVEHIASCLSKADADFVERLKISELGTVACGYNIAPGGGGFEKVLCKRGHVLADSTFSNGVCSECFKPYARARHAANPSKYKETRKAWYQKNREKIQARGRARRKLHKVVKTPEQKERQRLYKKEYRAKPENKAISRARSRAWRAANPEKLAAQRALANLRVRNRKRIAKLKAVFQDFDMAVFSG